MKKLLLWDIDGTIIISHGAGIRAMERSLTKCFGVTYDLRQIDWAGRTDSWISSEIFRHTGLPDTPENARAHLEGYLEFLPGELSSGRPGQVLPGVRELLASYHGHSHVAQGLLTGNLIRGAEIKLSHFGVWNYFPFGAYADDSSVRNDLGPHALRRAKDKHGVDFSPDQTFIIGDTPYDIECGKVIGARTIAVATGHYTVEELATHKPTAVFENLADIAAFARVIETN